MVKLENEIRQEKFRNEYQKLMINLIYTGNWLSSSHSRQLKPYGLSVQQYNILRILRGQHPEPAKVNILQERMLDKMSNASRLVEKLRQKGLLERRECMSDRRAVDVVITQKGLALLDELDNVVIEMESILHAINEEEACKLNSFLDQLRG